MSEKYIVSALTRPMINGFDELWIQVRLIDDLSLVYSVKEHTDNFICFGFTNDIFSVLIGIPQDDQTIINTSIKYETLYFIPSFFLNLIEFIHNLNQTDW